MARQARGPSAAAMTFINSEGYFSQVNVLRLLCLRSFHRGLAGYYKPYGV